MFVLATFLTISNAAHPTGTFTLSNFKSNTTTTSLRECDGQLYSTPNEPGNTEFDYTIINALNGDRNSVSFQSNKNKTRYIQVVQGTGVEANRLGVNVYNKLDQNAV